MKPLILALLMALVVSCSSNESQNTPITYGDTIALPQPAPQGGLTINEALWLRASSRASMPPHPYRSRSWAV